MRLQATFRQGLIIGLGGVAFALFGCLGAIIGMESDSSVVGALVFIAVIVCFAGAIAAIVGAGLFLIALIRSMFGSRNREP